MQPALQLALLVAILLPIGKLAASVCTRVGIPGILGELLAGVVLGPGAINLLHLRLFEGGQATGALMLLSQVGGIVLMFIAGIETDIDRMQEASKTAFIVAVSGVIWPFLLGTGSRPPLRTFVEHQLLPWWGPYRNECLDFGAHVYGRGANDLSGGDSCSRRCGNR